MNATNARDVARAALDAAIDRVNGRDAVRRALQADARSRSVSHVFAIGKAASSMYLGARDVLGDSIRKALLITKHGHLEPELHGDTCLQALESSHPVPDASSLAAGNALLEFIDAAPADARFLALVSGGASALIEVLSPGFGPADLARFNEWLLSHGLDIHAMNRLRKRASRIKGGRLAARLKGRSASVMLISDVTGDDPKSIGSGLLVPHSDADLDASGFDIPADVAALLDSPAPLCAQADFANVRITLVAGPADARAAAADSLRAAGVAVIEQPELIDGDALACGAELAHAVLTGPAGAQVWAGETTVVLPANPGRGGRSQALSLAAAIELAGHDGVVLLAAGTDGTDGPGEDAGGIVDGGTIERARRAGIDAAASLRGADAGTCLAACGDLVTTGPTGTNVMDLVIGLRIAAS